MEYKAWEFENDWYVSINGGLTFCMNQEAACIEFVEAIAKVEYLKDLIVQLRDEMSHKPTLTRLGNETADDEFCNCNSSRISISNPELCGACGKRVEEV
jgi:hypothetical protein